MESGQVENRAEAYRKAQMWDAQWGSGHNRRVRTYEADRSWMPQAACKGMEPNLFHPKYGTDDGGLATKAKAVCAECPVRKECLEYALAIPEHLGIWGGMTPYERKMETLKRRQLANQGRKA